MVTSSEDESALDEAAKSWFTGDSRAGTASGAGTGSLDLEGDESRVALLVDLGPGFRSSRILSCDRVR